MNDLISRNAAVQRVANVSPVMQPAEALASLNYHLGFTDGRKAATSGKPGTGFTACRAALSAPDCAAAAIPG